MRNDNEIFKSVLTRFVVEEDPLLAMLEWMMKQLMEIEVANKLRAQREEHSPERQG